MTLTLGLTLSTQSRDARGHDCRLEDAGRGAPTIRRMVAVLSSALSDAVERRRLTHNALGTRRCPREPRRAHPLDCGAGGGVFRPLLRGRRPADGPVRGHHWHWTTPRGSARAALARCGPRRAGVARRSHPRSPVGRGWTVDVHRAEDEGQFGWRGPVGPRRGRAAAARGSPPTCTATSPGKPHTRTPSARPSTPPQRS